MGAREEIETIMRVCVRALVCNGCALLWLKSQVRRKTKLPSKKVKNALRFGSFEYIHLIPFQKTFWEIALVRFLAES